MEKSYSVLERICLESKKHIMFDYGDRFILPKDLSEILNLPRVCYDKEVASRSMSGLQILKIVFTKTS